LLEYYLVIIKMEIEDRFKIKNSEEDCHKLWIENMRLAIGIEDKNDDEE